MIRKFYPLFFPFLAIFAFFLEIYRIFCFWYHQAGTNNSDLLFPLAITQNLIHEHGHISDWILTPTPYLFPDIFIHLLISLFSANIALNLSIFAFIQTLYFFCIILMLIRLITFKSCPWYISLLFILAVLFVSNELNNLSSLELFSTIFYAGMHFTSFLMILTCLYIFIIMCRKKNIYLNLTFFLITSISIFSDIVVGFYFTIPLSLTILVCAILKYIDFKNCMKLLALLFITTLCGYLLFKFFPLYYLRPRRIIQFPDGAIHSFLRIMFNFIKQEPILAITWLSFIFLAPFSLIKSHYKSKRNNYSIQMKWVDFIIFFQIIMVLVTIPLFILTDPNLIYVKSDNYLAMRHLQPFILEPILIGVPLLIFKHHKLFLFFKNKYLIGTCYIFIIIFSSFNIPEFKAINLYSYYPQEIACFDQHATKLHLHSGLANYWSARPFTLYNHSKSRFIAVDGNFNPFIWSTSLQNFKNDQLNFIMLKSHEFEKSKILARFGNPTTTFSCPGGFDYYVYNNKAMENLFPQKIIIDKHYKGLPWFGH